jgi:hypothetical protein
VIALSGNELFWLNPRELQKVRTTGGAVTKLAENLVDLGGEGALAFDSSTIYRIGAGFKAIFALPR